MPVGGAVRHGAIARRAVLQGAAIAGLCLCVRFSGAIAAEEPPRYGADAMPGGTVDDPLAFVSIDADGTVTLTVHRVEMGQGVRTSLPLVVADELEADWSKVRIVQAPANEARYGNQNTDGSRSLRHFFEPMRRVGASARTMLEAAAAARWGVPVSEVEARNHHVVHGPTGKSLGYGTLAADAARKPIPARDRLRLKDPRRFRYIGRGETHLVDGGDIVSGRAIYGIDVRLDGMLQAVVARPPVLGSGLAGFDASRALKVPGVVRVIEIPSTSLPAKFHPLGGVGIVARSTWAAIKAREALEVKWTPSSHASYDSAAFKTALERLVREPAEAVRHHGDAMAALKDAAKRVEATYYIPHVAHATMEPPAATARFTNGKCEVWACVQAPRETGEAVAAHLGLKPEDVTVNVTLLGGGFGRKSMPDFAVEAALMSKAMSGAPVKVTWTREDDLRHGYYHTVSVEHLQGAVDAQGRAIAWLHRSAAPPIDSTFDLQARRQAAFEYGMSAISIPFRIPNMRLEIPRVDAHTRIGWFRSVSNIPHAFAVQSFVAELAAATGRDPRDFLLELLGPPRRVDPRSLQDDWNYTESPERYPVDTARWRRVIEVASRAAGWGRRLPRGRGLGLAATYSFLTYVATVVEVAVNPDGTIRVPRVDIAVDCGPQVNPERVRAQAEGSCVMGISLASSEEVAFRNGAAQPANFHEYPVARIAQAPRAIHVHSIPSEFGAPLGGVGEPCVPPVAPALCNAIFAATGKRIRRLPIGTQLSDRT